MAPPSEQVVNTRCLMVVMMIFFPFCFMFLNIGTLYFAPLQKDLQLVVVSHIFFYVLPYFLKLIKV